MARLAIKVDVDTLRGYLEGVPRMLALFKRQGIRASIFFSFGPDNSGKAIRRIFRPGFISKMMRTKAPSTYGLKTLMYGTLLPAPLIVPTDPAIVRRALEGGHEVGIHAWDHVYVQDCLERISKEEYLSLYRKAEALYKDICGRAPTEIAAPGWQLSHAVLEAEQELGLAYASDVRGYSPFMPVFEGVEYGVPQIPTTLPTMDEIYGLPGINDVTIPKAWLDGMDKEWNVLTVHAEMEGISKLTVFENFLNMAKALGTEFRTLGEYAREASLPRGEIVMGTLTGRAGTLARQRQTDAR
ncbi:4-deoxy-4-formamido-L-arabinose-phosphoundecaprenol deformylase [Cloacibacillus porcorum]|uniref:polysaccharide deacetylase family protein n=1 Tax=Cloacibacillus porcorum TaxID=1197717 RepID=UPI001459F311|nr:polysaccharide deacetylase family protein [Cloacibacillus porcorum]MDY5389409.1 polysaccharide deacetylase family protein [Cloacibacillus porcorum]NMF19022.1 4-deoxy-4-formamido-L-arabinose-phosphoundecaprenol deformylase [Cloacibacillus porcorum]